MSAKLGEILVRENLISPQHLREALDYQREHGGRLGFNLVKLGLVSDDMITAVLSRQYGIPSVNLDLFHIDESVLRLIPQEVAQKYSVLPLSRVGADPYAAQHVSPLSQPLRLEGIGEIRAASLILNNAPVRRRSLVGAGKQ